MQDKLIIAKKEKFFDRKAYLDILEKRISGLLAGYRQNIAIIGDEFVGKTSVAFKFLERFYDNRIITLYLEARPEDLSSFSRRFIGVLLYSFLSNSGIPLKEDINFLIDKSQKYIPRTVEKINLILSNAAKKRKNVFGELFSLPEVINQETGKACVIILDEFHHLESLGVNNLYREWSKLLISQKNTMYVIISSMKFKTQAILLKDLSLLFGNFELVTVEPFDTKTSEEYLEYRLGSMDLNDGLRDFLVHFTGGYPFYLNIIAGALMKTSRNIGLADILENLLFDSSGILNQRFSNYMKRILDLPNSGDYVSILYLISSGRNKLKEIAHILRRQKKDLLFKINRLLEFDVITRNAVFLKINDRVFNFWLRFVYQGKLHSLTFDAKNQKTKFRDKIEGMIQDFLLTAQKPLTERMTEVLRLFEDETVQMERKKIKLSHFKEIKSLEFNNRNLKECLIGRSDNSLWIMAFKRELLTEEDVTDFARECKKYRHKLQRKIIVTLCDIDSNTRLKALEEKIWMWDVNALNQIFDLFLMPRLIA